MAYLSTLGTVTAQFTEDMRRAQTTWNSSQRVAFVNDALAMIGARLRTPANEGYMTLTADPTRTNIYTLPDDFVEMRFVTQDQGTYARNIDPIGSRQSGRFKTLASESLAYTIYSDTELPSVNGSPSKQTGTMVLQLIPGNTQDINIDYWQQPTQFPSNTGSSTTNPVLVAYDQLVLWGTEIFAWQSVQNWVQRDRVDQLFQAEMDRINKAANTARYGTGAAASAPARFYNSAPSRAM